MENPPLNCPTCLHPLLAEGAPPQSQWRSSCRCERAYSPGSTFSIEVCANCKKRVATVPAAAGASKVDCPGLCACPQNDAKKVPTFIKQNEKDAVTLDLSSVGMSADDFPIDRYAPIGLLGDGARATTILARDKQRGIKVAVKCFRRVAPALKPTFESEARKIKELNHTTIAKSVDFGYRGEKPYLVTEYKDGFNLEQNLSIYGTPTQDVAIKIMIGICEALLYGQKQGVMHRAVKPGNVIFLDDMNSEPSIMVVDFALPKVKASEKLTEARDALFMSADEARNLEYDERSEVYMVGCVGFALLAGRVPFVDGTAQEIKNAHALQLPPRISSLKFDNTRSSELEEIIERCLDKDPRNRFESIAKLQERLEVFPRRDQMRIAKILNARKMKKLGTIAAIVLAVVALSAGGFFLLGKH
jgi:serine/threonine-protein kinase